MLERRDFPFEVSMFYQVNLEKRICDFRSMFLMRLDCLCEGRSFERDEVFSNESERIATCVLDIV